MNEKTQAIQTPCPSCGSKSLFIGTGGHLTCSWLECEEPGLERKIAQLKAEKNILLEHGVAQMKEIERLKNGIDMAHLHLLASVCECGEPLKETDAFDCLDALKEGGW